MRWVLTDPRGVEEALANPTPSATEAQRWHSLLSRCTSPERECLRVLQENPPASSKDRLSVYAEGYFVRICEALAESFPVLKRVLEEDEFSRLIADYLERFPSTFPSLTDIGAELPEFLREHRLCGRYSFAADLAALEWRVLESFLAEDLPPLQVTDLEALASRGAEAWSGARLGLDSSVRLISVSASALEIWRRREESRERFPAPLSPSSMTADVPVIIYRKSLAVEVETMTVAAWQILRALENGRALGEAVDAADSTVTAEEFEAWFGSWVNRGVIRRIMLAHCSCTLA